MTADSHGLVALDADELPALAGGRPISYALGYTLGFLARLVYEADPFDGAYYGVGA